jgi:hypothetical protein
MEPIRHVGYDYFKASNSIGWNENPCVSDFGRRRGSKGFAYDDCHST